MNRPSMAVVGVAGFGLMAEAFGQLVMGLRRTGSWFVVVVTNYVYSIRSI